MRISDWSSDVCSSDLAGRGRLFRNPQSGFATRRLGVGPVPPARPPPYVRGTLRRGAGAVRGAGGSPPTALVRLPRHSRANRILAGSDRKSSVEGKSVSVRVELGGRGILKKKQHKE